jgi:hypothetical protein
MFGVSTAITAATTTAKATTPIAARTRSKLVPETRIKVQTTLFAQQMMLKAMEKKAPKGKKET